MNIRKRRYGRLQLWMKMINGDWESINCTPEEGMINNWKYTETSIYGVGFLNL